jgi:CysZ protein
VIPGRDPRTGRVACFYAGRVTDFLAGVGYFARGLGWVAWRPRQWLFGLVPALIVLVAYVVALAVVAAYDADLARVLSPFADHWQADARSAFRLLIGLLLYGAAVLVAVVTFAGAVGIMTALLAVVFFALGFLPAVGQTAVPVLAACVAGYFLTFEMTSIAFERRGVHRRRRFALLRRNRLLSVGFGVAVFVVFLIPLGAVLAMPGAVAGGTLLARERLVNRHVSARQDVSSGELGR